MRPVKTVEEANAFIAQIQKKHWDAKHNVYAYILREGNVKRYSDDGEPQGTAGVPTLDVLEKSGVTDVAVVVTRYFGGILLGGGGLVRAYCRAAQGALAAGGIITMGRCSVLTSEGDYPCYAKLLPFLEKSAAKIIDTDFSDKVCITLSIDSALEADFAEKIFDFSSGQVMPQKLGEKFAEK